MHVIVLVERLQQMQDFATAFGAKRDGGRGDHGQFGHTRGDLGGAKRIAHGLKDVGRGRNFPHVAR